jgi:CsoR family transcriptional regulator, copper-sensing transcriptional repressor
MNSAPESLNTLPLDSIQVSMQAEQESIDSLDPSFHPEDHNHDHEPGHVHNHIHDEGSLRRLVNRLSRIEGHIRGIKAMIQEHRPCPEVLTQVAAVRGALDRVACTILDEHLTECVVRAAKQGDSAKIDQEIAQLRSALKQFF